MSGPGEHEAWVKPTPHHPTRRCCFLPAIYVALCVHFLAYRNSFGLNITGSFDYAGRHEQALQLRLLLYYSTPIGGLKACAHSQKPAVWRVFYIRDFRFPMRDTLFPILNAPGAYSEHDDDQ